MLVQFSGSLCSISEQGTEQEEAAAPEPPKEEQKASEETELQEPATEVDELQETAAEAEGKTDEPPKEPEAIPEGLESQVPVSQEPEAKPEAAPEVETAPAAAEEVKAKEEVVTKREKVRSTRPNEGVDLAMESSGFASAQPKTVGEMFQETYQLYPNREALAYKEDGNWIPVTYSQYYANCLNAAKSFKKVTC